jgi:hypothetical protein
MTFDQRNQRSARTHKLDLESLGERIAPAVYHLGIVELAKDLGVKPAVLVKYERLFDTYLHDGGKAPVRFKDFIAGKAVPNLNVVVESSGTKAPFKHPILVTVTVTPPTGTFPLSSKAVTAVTEVNSTMTSVPIVTVVPPPTSIPTAMAITAPTAVGQPSPTSGGSPSNVSTVLISIFNQYEQDPTTFTGVSSADGPNLIVVGDEVGIQVHDSNPAEFQSLTAALTSAGMTFSSENATDGTVVGMLPIADLVTVAQFSQTISIAPEYSAVAK